jgi:hypothetical protein
LPASKQSAALAEGQDRALAIVVVIMSAMPLCGTSTASAGQ